MRGAILGDMIGAPYEGKEYKTKDFELFGPKSRFTDDTVMTIAVAQALMYSRDKGVEDEEAAVKKNIANSMRYWGGRHPHAGYGGKFKEWLKNSEMQAYNSFGNGSAMRVSSVGWLYDDLDTVKRMAAWSAEVTHNHPEGVKGAQAIACAVFLARTDASKQDIKEYITKEFHYDLNRTIDEIRPQYHFSAICQNTVPEAILAFMDGKNLEDVIRTAVSLGGDTDTIACMAGSIAEAYYGLPVLLQAECDKRVTEKMKEVLDRFDKVIGRKQDHIDRMQGNKKIEEALKHMDSDQDLIDACMIIAGRIAERGDFIIPVELPQSYFDMLDIENLKVGDTFQTKEEVRMKWLTLKDNNGLEWYAAFTDLDQMNKGAGASSINMSIKSIFEGALNTDDVAGVVINPWENMFQIEKELIKIILDTAKPKNEMNLVITDINKMDVECIIDVNGTGKTYISEGNKPVDYIIHGEFPEYQEQEGYRDIVKARTLECLDLAKEQDIHRLAFPALTAAIQGLPDDEAAEAVLETVGNWHFQNPDYGLHVIIVCDSDFVYDRYRRAMWFLCANHVNLAPEQYNMIDSNEIVAFSLAEGGAMGCPNEMIYVRKNGEKPEFLRSYANPEMYTLFPWLEHLDCGFFGEVKGVGKGWEHIDLGAGNHLFLRSNLYARLYPKFRGMRPAAIYQTWQDEVIEYLFNA